MFDKLYLSVSLISGLGTEDVYLTASVFKLVVNLFLFKEPYYINGSLYDVSYISASNSISLSYTKLLC